MNRLIKYVWVVLAVLAAGCSKSDGKNEVPVPGGVPGADGVALEGMVCRTFDFSAAGGLTAAVAPGTRADVRVAGPDETAVGDVWMLQFDTEASTEGKLIHRVYIPAQDISQSGSTLKATVMLRESARCVIVVLANAPESFTAALLPDGTKLTELRARTFEVSSVSGMSLPTDASVRLPMYGETEHMAVSLIGSQSVSVKLVRLASRVGLTLLNDFTAGYPRFELTDVTLRNAPTKIAYGPLTERTFYLGVVFPEASGNNFRNYDPVTTGLDGAETSYQWYIAPNRRGMGTATEPDEKNAMTAPDGQGNFCTHISIRGRVTMGAGVSPREVTYNIYLGGNSTNDYNLWANAAYSLRLRITGFNEDQMEVGYDGFGVTVGALDGLADNTITGWHPETGLDYIPDFLAFTPSEIDFGAEEYPAAEKVIFSVNSGWRFSYTSGNRDKVISSSSAAADKDHPGGAHGEPVECEVTFNPMIYKAQSGTPAAGTRYNTTATFTTVGGAIVNTRATILLRTVPAFYGEASVSRDPKDALPGEGCTIDVTMPSNAQWSVASSHGTMEVQQADTYSSRTCSVSIAANNTWESRQVTLVLQYGENRKLWTYTQSGISITEVSISPDPSRGIPVEGADYTITITGHFKSIPIRVRQTDGVIVGTGTVLKEGAEVSASKQLYVPINADIDDRTLVFEYQVTGQWKEIKRGVQKGGALWLQPIDPRHKANWSGAINYCNSLGNWRLPTQNELMYCYVINPGLDSKFTKGLYWTSSHVLSNSSYRSHVWRTNFKDGTTSDLRKESDVDYVRCVARFAVKDYPKVVRTSDGGIAIKMREGDRGIPQEAVRTEHWSKSVMSPPESDQNRVASTIQIQKVPSNSYYSQSNAKEYCDNLVAEGHDDWRLPTQREIMVIWFMGANSLVHNGEKNDTGVGAATYRVGEGYLYEQSDFVPFGAARHWTSSKWYNAVYDCWYGVFYDGSASPGVIAADSDGYGSLVRCVRDVR